jgi:hypothetical protein
VKAGGRLVFPSQSVRLRPYLVPVSKRGEHLANARLLIEFEQVSAKACAIRCRRKPQGLAEAFRTIQTGPWDLPAALWQAERAADYDADEDMRRRYFITLLGGAAAAWPLAARAQQPKLPTIGFLGSTTSSAMSQWVAAFVQRLRELGWIEGRTVAIEYRWAEGRIERYAEIAAELFG